MPAMHEDMITRGLPKWPQMLTTGVPVTVEQAKEIIRRTDAFFSLPEFAGNDRRYSKRVMGAIDYPMEPEGDKDWINRDWMKRMDAQVEWCSRWGFISTEYVCNAWIACAFIYGPHGWCHPDGDIGYVDNVGKWPSVEAVLEEWKTLAAAFPFLDVGVTLMDGESGEDRPISPVVSIRVKDGEARLVDPAAEDVHAGHPPATRRGKGTAGLGDAIVAVCFAPASVREQAIPWEWIEEWGKRMKDPILEFDGKPSP